MKTLELSKREPGKFTQLESTVRFAMKHRESIESLLINLPGDWDLGDRILCYLHPEYQMHIEQYYGNGETMLIDLMSGKEIRQLDQQCKERLKEKISYSGKPASKEKLISNFYMVKEKLGRVPNLTELGEQGKFGQRTYHKKFGGYRRLLEELNETPPPKKKRLTFNSRLARFRAQNFTPPCRRAGWLKVKCSSVIHRPHPCWHQH